MVGRILPRAGAEFIRHTRRDDADVIRLSFIRFVGGEMDKTEDRIERYWACDSSLVWMRSPLGYHIDRVPYEATFSFCINLEPRLPARCSAGRLTSSFPMSASSNVAPARFVFS